MKQKQQLRRLILRLAIADSKGYPIPFLRRNVWNRQVIRLADKIIARRTHISRFKRRYGDG